MPNLTPVATGLVGLGGYAANIGQLLLEERGQAAPEDQQVAHLLAACSSNPARHAERVAELEKHGVTICASFEQMLERDDIEAVWLPLPIDLHRPYTEKALAAGKAVMLEKPIAGCIDDADAIAAASAKAGLPVAIGFQDIYDPATMQVKKRLLDGAIGQVTGATVWAVWPRDDHYYGRAGWAGAMKKDGVWVMDSPANNALSHFINITLFFMGSDVLDAAALTKVEAELYRANPIENYDTISMRLTTAEGLPILVLLTHAGRETHHPSIRIHGEKGTVSWQFEEPCTIKVEPDDDGKSALALTTERSRRPHKFMAERFTKLLRGVDDPDIALSTIENARPQLLAINGASEATAVADIPGDQIDKVKGDRGTTNAVKGIEQAFQRCAADQCMLHESGLLPWTQPAGVKSLEGYATFAGPKGYNG